MLRDVRPNHDRYNKMSHSRAPRASLRNSVLNALSRTHLRKNRESNLREMLKTSSEKNPSLQDDPPHDHPPVRRYRQLSLPSPFVAWPAIVRVVQRTRMKKRASAVRFLVLSPRSAASCARL